MEIPSKKRVRSANWDEEEKRLLRQLVIERIEVIENKDTSTNTNCMKKAAWQEVLSCFNSLNNKKRDLKEITIQWRNMKGKVKTRDSEYKRAKLMTGGGPPPPSPPAEDLAIIEAIPNEFVVDSNCFDSDSVHNNILNQKLLSPTTEAQKSCTSSSTQEINKELLSPTAGAQKSSTDFIDPWTPLPSSSTQEMNKIPDENQETNKILTKVPKPLIKKNLKKVCKEINYEQELFLITKLSKERENERAEEIHKKKIAILDLEYEYWKKKLNKIE